MVHTMPAPVLSNDPFDSLVAPPFNFPLGTGGKVKAAPFLSP